MLRSLPGFRWLPSALLTMALGSALLVARAPLFAAAATKQASPPRAAAAAALGSHPHGAPPPGEVAAQLSRHPDDVAYCASASLEPFDGALAQLRAAGTGEAAGRLRWCLMETLFGHTDRAVAEELGTYAARIADCYRPLLTPAPPPKPDAVAAVTGCVIAMASRVP